MNVDTRASRNTTLVDGAADTGVLDDEAFARRLANLMVYRRKEMHRSLGAMARRSCGRFTRR